MSTSAAIHIVSLTQFDSGTAQTPSSERRAAIAPALGIASVIWGGLFEVEPGSRTGIHHHGEHGNQPFEHGAVSMGCRAQHRNACSHQPAGRHLAVSLMFSGGLQDGTRP
jgi:hypothetical protein